MGTETARNLTVREAVAETKLSRSRLLELAYAGEIQSFKIGRRRLFPRTGLDEFQRRAEAGEFAPKGAK